MQILNGVERTFRFGKAVKTNPSPLDRQWAFNRFLFALIMSHFTLMLQHKDSQDGSC